MFDLTPHVALTEKYQKTYRLLQVLFYLGMLIFGILVLVKIFFPTQYFTFSFLNSNSTKNTLTSPRTLTDESALNGKISANDGLLFDASLVGNFSQVKVEMELNKKSAQIETGSLIIRKSYLSFLYPQGNPVGFRNGSLLKNSDNYYIISDNKLRKFDHLSVALLFGFSQEAFKPVEDDELLYNEKGESIAFRDYPEGALFKIQDKFYQLEDNELKKFVTSEAYFSQYNLNQAIEKPEDFLQKYPLSNELIGFPSGTLISYADSVYVVSGKEILPIGDITIFEAAGYNWSDVHSASGDEIALYEKGKMFTLSNAHPDGTVFVTKEKGTFYLIEGETKRIIPSENIMKSWSKFSPILVSEESLKNFSQCDLKRQILDWGKPSYYCEMFIENLNNFDGKDYEFRLANQKDIEIDVLDVKFEKVLNKNNLNMALASLFSRIRKNYDN